MDPAGPPGTEAVIRLLARPYGDSEVQRLVRALYSEQIDTYGFADSPDREAAADYVQPLGVLLVAYASTGEGVGCGGYRAYDEDERVAEVRKMYVLPELRGHGLGRTILQQLEMQAAEGGARTMLLETGALNHSAIRLYAAAGYLPIPPYVQGRSEINRAFVKAL